MKITDNGHGLFWQPLGGNNPDQISGHCYRYTLSEENASTTILIDLGKFDNYQAFGIKNAIAAVPDITRLLQAENSPQALLLTHSHPDHLNGIIHYVRAGVRLPMLYGGKYTKIILDDLCDEFHLPESLRPAYTIIKAGDILQIGNMEIEAVAASHTCFDAMGFIIKTPYATVYHTGDMKLDASTCFRKPTDIKRLRQRAHEINWTVADCCDIVKDGYAVTEKENLRCFYNLLRKNKNKKVFIPVYPTHQQMYILAFLAALKYKKDVIFYGSRDFYSYLRMLQQYGIDFGKLAGNRIKVYYYPHVDFKTIGKNFVVIGTFNDIPQEFGAHEKNSFGLITAISYFNPLKGKFNAHNIPFAALENYPQLQACGHGFLKDFEALTKILPYSGFIPTHCPVFVIDYFRKLAEFLSIRLIKYTPHNGYVYKFDNNDAVLANKENAHWMIFTKDSREPHPVLQKPSSGEGFLKRTISRRRCLNKFKEYLHQRKNKGDSHAKV